MNLMSRPDELNFYVEFLHLLEEFHKERVIIKARSFLSLRSIFNVQKTTSVFLLKVLKNNLKLLGQLYLTCIHLSIPNISIKVNPEQLNKQCQRVWSINNYNFAKCLQSFWSINNYNFAKCLWRVWSINNYNFDNWCQRVWSIINHTLISVSRVGNPILFIVSLRKETLITMGGKTS